MKSNNITIMKQAIRILGILLAVVLLGIGYLAYSVFINPKSPKETVTLNVDDLTLEVVYSRPYKKDRLLFGEAEKEALVPYGSYWRLGANAATTFSTSKDISFAGRMLKAGIYRLYAIPEKDHWVIALNKEYSAFGYSEPDYEQDIMRVNMASASLLSPVEQFTIQLINDEGDLSLDMRWDTTAVAIPID